MIPIRGGTFVRMHPVEVLGVSVMNEAWSLTFALTVPLFCLGLLLLLSRLEDTLGDGLEEAPAARDAVPAGADVATAGGEKVAAA